MGGGAIRERRSGGAEVQGSKGVEEQTDRVNRGRGARDVPSAMEFSSLPLDPIYAWGIVLEPVETLVGRTSDFVEQLARETYARGEPYSEDELEGRFLSFFDRLVREGTLRRLPDAPPEMGRRILGPRRWLRAQQIRIERLVKYCTEQADPD
jgi:hypothetical protein